MLQEILLSLSGYDSEIWDKLTQGGQSEDKFNQYVSQPEQAMLQTLANLSAIHLRVKTAVARISKSHSSVICRAVAVSVSKDQLGKFHDKILSVESSILRHDAAFVGGYGIVPLSKIVSEFAPWTRRLEWLENVAKHAEGVKGATTRSVPFTGKQILDFLQSETHTGYIDLQDMATQLLMVAQRVWIRAMASWVVYGRLTSLGPNDFPIQPTNEQGRDAYILDHSLLPTFVDESTAETILSIGIALNQIQSQSNNASTVSILQSTNSIIALMPQTLKLVESISYPIEKPVLDKVVHAIDQSISNNALSQLLPTEQLLAMLRVIHQYVLLQSGEFSISLVKHAEEQIAKRKQQATAVRPVRKVGRLTDLTINDKEMNTVLNKTWAELMSLQTVQDLDEQVLLLARKCLKLLPASNDGQPLLISTLLPTKCILDIDLPVDSAMRLFLTAQDSMIYSVINGFLISVRRAELHLADLWKITSQRRCYQTPIGPPFSSTPVGQRALSGRRAREYRRSRQMRKHWATVSKVHFLISELDAFYHGEIIQNHWAHFNTWLSGNPDQLTQTTSGEHSLNLNNSNQYQDFSTSKNSNSSRLSDRYTIFRNDPRFLAKGHRRFLATLKSALLLDRAAYVTTLQTLLTMLDHYVALFHRLNSVWQGLDLQEDEGVVDAFSDFFQDEKQLSEEMNRTRGTVEATLTEIVKTLEDTEKDRMTDVVMDDMVELNLSGSDNSYKPLHTRTMDRLVFKLDCLSGDRRYIDEPRPGTGLEND